jgi:predicted enzyme related to lactoylglutathione lyase
MNEVISHRPGTVCWTDLGTTDLGAGRAFYQELFGWDAEESDMPEGVGTYTSFQQDGRDVAGAYPLMEEQRAQGVPPHWLLYTAVEDVDTTAATARSNGGTVVAEPMDVPGVGRMAVLQDPEGATFAVMQLTEHSGLGKKDAPGALCWTELSARDPEGATAFYGTLFGWDARTQETPGGPYTMFSLDDTDVGGMVQMDEEWGDMPAAWMPYFGIADLDATLEQVPKLGGEVAMGPIEAEGVGRFAVVQDSQGAFLSIIQLDAFG